MVVGSPLTDVLLIIHAVILQGNSSFKRDNELLLSLTSSSSSVCYQWCIFICVFNSPAGHMVPVFTRWILGAGKCNSQRCQCHSSVTTYSHFYCFRFIPIYRGPSHTYKIQRLTESTCYSFRIQAVNDAGEGPFSEICTFCTTKSLPPAIKGM